MYFTITSEQILGVCGLIVTLGGVWRLWKEIKKPNEEVVKMVRDHETKLSNDDKRLKEIEEADKLILQSLLVIINHDITGNGVEQLKNARDELQEFLINK